MTKIAGLAVFSFVALLILKLTGLTADLSWGWVACPIWICAILYAIFAVVVLVLLRDSKEEKAARAEQDRKVAEMNAHYFPPKDDESAAGAG